MASKQQQKQQSPWRTPERHYCEVCNAWMGSDRTSVLIHENGKKHKEKLEESLVKRRMAKSQLEMKQKDIANVLKRMEAAAVASVAPNNDSFSGVILKEEEVASGAPIVHPKKGSIDVPRVERTNKWNEMDSWQDRKRKREESRRSHLPQDNSEENLLSKERQDMSTGALQTTIRKKLQGSEGHYEDVDSGTIYLQGSIYAPIFEDDIPVQIWTGAPSTTDTITEEVYRRGKDYKSCWKNGIILKVHLSNNNRKENDTTTTTIIGDATESMEDSGITCDVAYLSNLNSNEEIIEKNVVLSRLRLVLGSDDAIPSTIEEARLALEGDIEMLEPVKPLLVDENTGLSSWNTISIRKVTRYQTLKDERVRLKAQKQLDLLNDRRKQRKEEERNMEEAKFVNTDDSALSAHYIWPTTTTNKGYKGVDIYNEEKPAVITESTVLSKSNMKGFKKPFHRGQKMKKHSRTTSPDDDDD